MFAEHDRFQSEAVVEYALIQLYRRGKFYFCKRGAAAERRGVDGLDGGKGNVFQRFAEVEGALADLLERGQIERGKLDAGIKRVRAQRL